MYLFIAAREATAIEVLPPPPLVKKGDERAPEQLSCSRLQFTVFFHAWGDSKMQEYIFAGESLVAFWTLESGPINRRPGTHVDAKTT